MGEPGDPAGDCRRCGGERVQVGHGSAVVGVYCDPCDLLTALHPTRAAASEDERFWTDPVERAAKVGAEEP